MRYLNFILPLLAGIVWAFPAGCELASKASAQISSSAKDAVSFKYVDDRTIVVPVKVCGQETLFMLDTGAGTNLVSQKLADKFSCRIERQFTGRRMSGQNIHMKIARIPSMQFGSCVQEQVPAATWNMEELFQNDPQYAGIEGIVSLNFFKSTPFTVDYHQGKIFIEDAESLKRRLEDGFSVPISVKQRDGIDTDVKVSISISNGKSALVEVALCRTVLSGCFL